MSTAIGKAFERRVKDYLESLDLYVIQSEKSRGVADLVAIGPKARPLMFVQCKHGGHLRIEEWNQLFETARRFGTMPVLASRSKNHEGEIDFYRLLAPRPLRSLDQLPMERLVFEAAEDLQTART